MKKKMQWALWSSVLVVVVLATVDRFASEASVSTLSVEPEPAVKFLKPPAIPMPSRGEKSDEPAQATPPKPEGGPETIESIFQLSEFADSVECIMVDGPFSELLTEWSELMNTANQDQMSAYGYEEDSSDYHSYSDEILESLAKGGDARANFLLGSKKENTALRAFVSTDRGLFIQAQAEARQHLFEAVVLGYTPAVNLLISSLAMDRLEAERSDDQATVDEINTEIVAWIAIERARNGILSLQSILAMQLPHDVSEEVKARGEQRAFAIQEDLGVQREQLGLAPFEPFPAQVNTAEFLKSFTCDTKGTSPEVAPEA